VGVRCVVCVLWKSHFDGFAFTILCHTHMMMVDWSCILHRERLGFSYFEE
jgi:hypothetical protein